LARREDGKKLHNPGKELGDLPKRHAQRERTIFTVNSVVVVARGAVHPSASAKRVHLRGKDLTEET